MRLSILLLLMCSVAGAQSFSLKRGDKTVRIKKFDEVNVFSEKRGLKNDSLELTVRGQLTDFKKDTLLIRYDEYSVHDFYKKYPDTLHYTYEILTDTFMMMKVPAKDITGMFRYRNKLKSVTNKIVFVTLGTSLVTMPFVLAMKAGPERDAVSALNITSTVAMLSSMTVGLVFGKQKFWLKPKGPKTWEIQP